jgi:hypothetical protein
MDWDDVPDFGGYEDDEDEMEMMREMEEAAGKSWYDLAAMVQSGG